MYKLLLVSLVFYASASQAAESASVLPKGYFRARLVSVYTNGISNTFNNDGNVQGLSNSLNRSLSVNDLAAMNPDLKTLSTALNELKPGLGDELLSSQLYSNVNMQIEQYMPALEYGYSKRLTLGIRVPVVRRNVDATFEAISINNASVISQKVGSGISADVKAGLDQLSATQFDTAFYSSALFESKGYKAPGSFDKTELGDIEIGGKYKVIEEPQRSVSTQIGVRLPTGSTPAIDDLFDKGTGSGAWGVGALYFHNYRPTKSLDFGAMAKVIYNLPDTRQRAVPLNEFDSIPSVLPEDGQVHDVTRYQPLEFSSEVSTTYKLNEGEYEFWGAYQFKASGKDTFTGSGNLYYAGLSEGTDYMAHGAEVGAVYSTINAFRKKEFAIPMKLQALVNTTFAGKNTPLASFVRFDTIFFF